MLYPFKKTVKLIYMIFISLVKDLFNRGIGIESYIFIDCVRQTFFEALAKWISGQLDAYLIEEYRIYYLTDITS